MGKNMVKKKASREIVSGWKLMLCISRPRKSNAIREINDLIDSSNRREWSATVYLNSCYLTCWHSCDKGTFVFRRPCWRCDDAKAMTVIDECCEIPYDSAHSEWHCSLACQWYRRPSRRVWANLPLNVLDIRQHCPICTKAFHFESASWESPREPKKYHSRVRKERLMLCLSTFLKSSLSLSRSSKFLRQIVSTIRRRRHNVIMCCVLRNSFLFSFSSIFNSQLFQLRAGPSLPHIIYAHLI